MLSQKIHENLILAMKAGDTVTRDTLRFLEAEIKKRAIDTRKELGDEEVQKVIVSQVKSRKDSISQFLSGGREDLANPEILAVEILEKYLPSQMEDGELEKLVKIELEQAGISDVKDMGRAMGIVMAKIAGRADGNRVREKVQKFLS